MVQDRSLEPAELEADVEAFLTRTTLRQHLKNQVEGPLGVATLLQTHGYQMSDRSTSGSYLPEEWFVLLLHTPTLVESGPDT